MRILIYSLSYAPELTGVGKYTGEMAQWLASRGWDVRVVTTPPFYPQWQVHQGFRAAAYTQERRQGVRVFRCPVWVPRQPSGPKRLLHLLSFCLSSLPVLFAQLFWRPQLVLAIEPSLLTTPAALLLSKLCGARSWLHVQDFEVEAGFNLGLVSSGRFKNLVLGSERWLMRRFDRVSTISVRMLERLRNKGVRPSRTLLFPNWADVIGIRPLNRPSTYRHALGIPSGDVVALYSGNMGHKQGLEILIEAARSLQARRDLHFVLCGDGAMRETLFEMARSLPNVQFLELQPMEHLGELLGMADIHLLPQKGDAADLVLPSKLTGMLSSGRPVLATAELGTELDRLVQGVGLVVPPGELALLVDALLRLAEDPALRADLGRMGRQFAEQFLGRDSILERFERVLERSVRGSDVLSLHEPSPSPVIAADPLKVDNPLKRAA